MCGISVTSIKTQAESQQLSNITYYLAAKSMELISTAPVGNLTSTLTLELPISVGNQGYWIQLFNDSSNAYAGSGLGLQVSSNQHQSQIPSDVDASGIYLSGFGPAFLEYQLNSTGSYLTLYGGS